MALLAFIASLPHHFKELCFNFVLNFALNEVRYFPLLEHADDLYRSGQLAAKSQCPPTISDKLEVIALLGTFTMAIIDAMFMLTFACSLAYLSNFHMPKALEIITEGPPEERYRRLKELCAKYNVPLEDELEMGTSMKGEV
ncbi:hypothetical protein IFR04_005874 [Cadophora malorum]|uniref:Uncharacterized protein n=1 Tax=Cadophora malorum TaxID=108018 RepID=A0A8H7TG41_9HELO|nr:hypothetical protein IFR04_005874 [Cadophora malorum]